MARFSLLKQEELIVDSLKDQVEELEKEAIRAALRECGGVMAKAARRLGITERMIGYKIRKYGIGKEEHQQEAGRGSTAVQGEGQR